MPLKKKKKSASKKTAIRSQSKEKAKIQILRDENHDLKRQLMVVERLRREATVETQIESATDAHLLTAGIAHEFNNILGAIEGHAEWALEVNQMSSMRESLEIVKVGCNRAANITRSLQSFMQPQEERKKIFSLELLKKEVSKLWGPRFKKDHVECNFEELDFDIYAQFDQMLEVFVNLIKNSLEAFPESFSRKKKLQLKVLHHNKERVTLLFSDSGIGIPKEFQTEIFKPFFTTKGVLSRLHRNESPTARSSIKSYEGGSGLGLFLSRSILQSYGGNLTLFSSTPQGTSFQMDLKLAHSE